LRSRSDAKTQGAFAVAGPRFHPLFAVAMGFLAVFVIAVIALILADVFYTRVSDVFSVLESKPILAAIRLSAATSVSTLVLVILFAIPIGYALSRYRFPGHVVADTIVDLPMVLPPLIVGVSLLVFFRTSVGQWIESLGLRFVYTVQGIVLCQFFTTASYGIRAAKAAFDGVDPRLENLALTLGCTRLAAFRRVVLPLARNGLIAGGIMAWAHAVGLYGPLMVFAGAVEMKTEVMPTAIFLELSVGHIETALAVTLVMLVMAMAALILVHWLAPGRKGQA
jgi:molybdate transport system permease protein